MRSIKMRSFCNYYISTDVIAWQCLFLVETRKKHFDFTSHIPCGASRGDSVTPKSKHSSFSNHSIIIKGQ